MRESTKDRAEGKYHEVKGKVKESTGETIGNPKVAIEGRDEKLVGKLKEKYGRIKKDLDR